MIIPNPVHPVILSKKDKEGGMEHGALTEKIIGCAYRIYNTMGFGYLESVYEKCMLIELEQTGLRAQAQHPIEVRYNGIPVGDFIADIMIEDTVIVELKSLRSLNPAHEVQLVNYLVATDKPVGLLLNVGESKVDVKRKVRVLNSSCQSCNPVRKDQTG